MWWIAWAPQCCDEARGWNSRRGKLNIMIGILRSYHLSKRRILCAWSLSEWAVTFGERLQWWNGSTTGCMRSWQIMEPNIGATGSTCESPWNLQVPLVTHHLRQPQVVKRPTEVAPEEVLWSMPLGDHTEVPARCEDPSAFQGLWHALVVGVDF